MVKPISLAWGVACAAALFPSVSGAFALDFDAVSSAGLPVAFHLDLVPGVDYLTVTNSVAADGTLQRRTSGLNDVMGPAWTLTEQGGQSLHAIDSPSFNFQVDSFLHPDGSSELKLGTYEVYTPGRTHQEFSELSFTLTCACSDLYSQQITASSFAKYDLLSGGEAKVLYRDVMFWPDDSTTVNEDRRVVQFSAVPEPSTVALMLVGGIAVSLVRRRSRAASRQ